MNKYRLKIITIIVLLIVVLLCICVACNGNTRKFSFSQESYTVYADEETQFQLEVTIKPTSADYTLVSSNERIVQVLDDGITLQIVSYPGIVTITGTSGDKTATCTVQTLASSGSNSSDSGTTSKDTYTVTFHLEYGSVADQEVSPNGTASVPETSEYMGMVVGGWYIDEDCTEEYDFSTAVVSDLTLYAKFVSTSEPYYTYETQNSRAYISGFLYNLVDYGHVDLPTYDTDGRLIYGIAEEAFAGCTTVTSITIPSTYEDIQANAFNSCSNLVSVVFDGQSSLVSIGNSAFEQCSSLTDITIPSTVVMKSSSDTTLGTAVFAYCTSLTSITLPESIEIITQQMFYSSGLTSIDLTNITYIGFQAFKDASDLASATNTSNITDIRGYAFDGTELLTDLLYYSSTNTAYLDDILLYTTLTNGNTILISEEIRLIASLAVYDPDVSNVVFLEFESDTPISLSTYSIGSHVDIIVPVDAVDTYISAWGSSFSSQIFYKEIINMTEGGYDDSTNTDGELTILVREDTNSTTDEEWVITIMTYTTEDATKVNVYSALYDMFGYYVRVNNILSTAFYKINTLLYITLPAYISYISMNAISVVSNLSYIWFDGWISSSIVSGIKVDSSAINPFNETYKIFVPAAYLSKYTASTSAMLSYSDHFTSYTETTYTVDFVASGYTGDFVEEQIIDKNGKVTEPNTDVYEDIIFYGWYTDEECTIEYDFSKIVTGDFTLYAKFDLVDDE